jgi:hypothetical protein
LFKVVEARDLDYNWVKKRAVEQLQRNRIDSAKYWYFELLEESREDTIIGKILIDLIEIGINCDQFDFSRERLKEFRNRKLVLSDYIKYKFKFQEARLLLKQSKSRKALNLFDSLTLDNSYLKS